MTPLLQDLVNHRCYGLVGDRHGARSLSRAVSPGSLEYASNAFDIGGITNHGPDAVSLDRRGAVWRRHDQRGDAHRDGLIELGWDLELLLLREDDGQAGTGYHVESLGAREWAQHFYVRLHPCRGDGVVERPSMTSVGATGHP
jgi:hypothetical protein